LLDGHGQKLTGFLGASVALRHNTLPEGRFVRLRDRVHQHPDRLPVDRQDEVLAGREMPIQRARADAGQLADRVQGDAGSSANAV